METSWKKHKKIIFYNRFFITIYVKWLILAFGLHADINILWNCRKPPENVNKQARNLWMKWLLGVCKWKIFSHPIRWRILVHVIAPDHTRRLWSCIPTPRKVVLHSVDISDYLIGPDRVDRAHSTINTC